VTAGRFTVERVLKPVGGVLLNTVCPKLKSAPQLSA